MLAAVDSEGRYTHQVLTLEATCREVHSHRMKLANLTVDPADPSSGESEMEDEPEPEEHLEDGAYMLEELAPTLAAIQNNLQVIQQAMLGITGDVIAATAMGQSATDAANATTSPLGRFRSPLSPRVAEVIDLNSKEGRKHYEQATKSLFPSNEKFEVEPNKFQLFINLLHVRADGGNAIVPQDHANPQGPAINSTSDYGRTNLEQVRAWEKTFIGSQSRNRQNSKILYELIVNLLSVQGFQRIQVWQH